MTLLRTAVSFLALPALLLAQGYGGPSVLSRGVAPSSMVEAPISFQPYVSLLGVYDTGLAGAFRDTSGKISNDAIEGVELSVGTYGLHQWRHTSLQLGYQGVFRHYTQKTYYDGTDQSLALSLSHQLSRRVTFALRESAGMYTRAFGFGDYLFYDPSVLLTPGPNILDNRTIYLSTGGDLTYRRSARLSFNFGASGYVVRRQSSALYGLTGYDARSDVAYRLSRSLSVGLAYNFTHYDYLKAFGVADYHSLGILFSYRINKALEVGIRGGASRVETLFLQSVPLDPVIAAITGQTSGILAKHGINYTPLVEASLSYVYGHSRFTASYLRGISPGNGILLTTRQETGSVSYSYNGLRSWSLNANAAYYTLTGLSTTTGSYRSYIGGIQASRSLWRSAFGLSMGVFANRYNINTGTFRRNQYRATVGLTYSPGQIPIRFW